MDKISDEFETCPDRIINIRVTSTDCSKRPLFDLVISITPSVLIQSS